MHSAMGKELKHTSQVNHSGKLKTQAFPEGSSSLDVHIVTLQGSFDYLTLKWSEATG